MSSVILGVIGILLTIGLVVAGGFYLGSALGTSRFSSDASVVMQDVRSIVEAIHRYEARTGLVFLAAGSVNGIPDLVPAGVLRVVPANPHSRDPSRAFNLAGLDFGSPQPGSPLLVVGNLGANRRLCEAIARLAGTLGAGQSLVQVARPSAQDVRVVDCVQMNAAFAESTWMTFDLPGDFMVVMRV